MKKQTGFIAVLSASAIMAFAAPMFGAGEAGVAFAQEKSGWVDT